MISSIILEGKTADWAPEAQLDAPVVLLVQSKSASIVTLPLPVETESAEMHSSLQLITCANRS
jgi:hypothetical protein